LIQSLQKAKSIVEISKTTVTHNDKKLSCCCCFFASSQPNTTVNNMDPAAFQASLVCIGFSVLASAFIVFPAGKGVLFTDLANLANEDIATLCSALRPRPGGMIPDPAGVLICTRGIPMSALAERHLKIVVFLAGLFERRINRTLMPATHDQTVGEIQNAQTLMERDAAHHNPNDTAKIEVRPKP
jgi:hypothetical protein